MPPAYGDANVWGHRAKQEGYQVNMTPAVGAVAWWETPMHVAWVSAVNGDTVEIEEYNYGVRYTYGRRVIPKMPLAATFILKTSEREQPTLNPP